MEAIMAKRLFHASAAIVLIVLTYHVGARNVGAQTGSNQEVAVLSGTIAHDGTIPLPRYQDGTEASESECEWTVSMSSLRNSGAGAYTRLECFTEGRVVRAFGCPQVLCDGNGPVLGSANYMIIAVRNTSPTTTGHGTWGGVKRRYK
jgi:hypothetical protein